MNSADNLWQFATRFYALTAVEERCLRLQNQWQLNVNYLLLALWHGLSGRGVINAERFNQWRHATQELEQSISWLRLVRQSVKAQLGTHGTGPLQDYYLALRETELKGEQALQTQLATWAKPICPISPSQRSTDALHCLQEYVLAMDRHDHTDLQKDLQELTGNAIEFSRQFNFSVEE